eukprot:Gregarina_sp_Poly_1__115@NODE_1025_length_5317_cov_10_710857_g715_i0_p3_GENE_NODE_1025_length_5317_cov_10_710857_g715_i0NODE_1025_length_5317_cov_10_710857_g715_i0_p3_ORF_typecomplete_len235_score23_75DZR/PF12773_7/0_039_NODE_1025_length_5317_cov_10_710857_g715_i05401244
MHSETLLEFIEDEGSNSEQHQIDLCGIRSIVSLIAYVGVNAAFFGEYLGFALVQNCLMTETETEMREISPLRKFGVYRISEIQLESQTPKGICSVNWTEYVQSLRSAKYKNPPPLWLFSPLICSSKSQLYAISAMDLSPRVARIIESHESTSNSVLALLKLALQTPQFYFLLRRTTASYFDFFSQHRAKFNFCGRCAARLPEPNHSSDDHRAVVECHLCGPTVRLPPNMDFHTS